jgi:hypothetical protein
VHKYPLFRVVATIGAAAVSVSLSGCKPSAADIQGLKNCVGTEFLSADQIRYVGPTTEGAGSIWLKVDNKAIIIGAPAAQFVGAPPRKELVSQPALGANCQIDTKTKIDLTASLGASIDLLPVSGELKAGLKNSKIESVVIEGFQLEDVFGIPYEKVVASEAARDPGLTSRLAGNDVLAAVRMVKVSSYKATLDITTAVNGSVAAKYNGPLPGGTKGELKPEVSAATESGGKLTLTIPGSVYIAGVFRPIRIDGAGVRLQSAGVQGAASVPLTSIPISEASISENRSWVQP